MNSFQGARYITIYNVTCEPAHLLVNLVAAVMLSTRARERRKAASAFMGIAAVRFAKRRLERRELLRHARRGGSRGSGGSNKDPSHP